jgi:hypothetical protein
MDPTRDSARNPGVTILESCLRDLERRIVPDQEEELEEAWREFASGGSPRTGVFSPRRARPVPPGIEWPRVTVNEALADPDLMALQQYAPCSRMLAEGSGELMCVRPNYGTGILPSLFGVRPFIMEDSANTLPTNWPLDNGSWAIAGIVSGGVPDFNTELFAKCLEMGRKFVGISRKYPRIGRWVHVYHPDLQGPLDVCELLWGSDLFINLYEKPDLVKGLLELVTGTYVACMKEWRRAVPAPRGTAVHWSMMHAGTIMLRNDSAMNLSPAMYAEFARPYDAHLLDEFGGGGIHSCGRVDHYIASAAGIPGLGAFNLSQPHLNDMEAVFRGTVDRGIPLIGLDRKAADTAIARGRDLRGLVHCW